MSAVDIAHVGYVTITRDTPVSFTVTWPGHIGPNQWCGFSANVENFDLNATETLVVVNQGSHHDGERDAYSAFVTLQGSTDREGELQVNLIVMSAVDLTF